MCIFRSARSARAAWSLLAALIALPAARAQVIPNESLVVYQRDLLDPEYSQARAEVTWCDINGTLWVANVNRDTGLFEPSDGKGTAVDVNAMASADFRLFDNGPEWVGTQYGDQIVYTAFPPGQAHIPANARLSLAWQSSRGTWSLKSLSPNLPRSTPYASLNEGDPEPTISYIDPSGDHYWRNLYYASSETRVPLYAPSRLFALRIAQGVRAAAFDALVNGVQQVFIYWFDTGETEQITFDDSQKDLDSRPFVWQAPEYDGDLVMETVANGTEIRVYHLPAGGSGTHWTLVDKISTPGNGVINSPEPFEYNGKSYIFFAADVPPLDYPSAIFMTGIDADHPSLRQLTPNRPLRQRSDPEVFIANDGPYIYFNRGSPPTGQVICYSGCNEGIFRTYTGLAPAQERPVASGISR